MHYDLLPTLAAFDTAAQADDVLWTALCDLHSMIDRGGITVDAKAVKAISAALLTCYEQLPAEFWPEMVVKTMASLQGLCIHQTWDDWQLLNGC
ncbi:MAG: hypothetical protein ACPGYZ_10240 [Flavobacteriales bacterium]